MNVRCWLVFTSVALLGCSAPTSAPPVAPPPGATAQRDTSGTITGLTFAEDQTDDRDLAALTHHPFLQELRLLGSPWEIQITDASVETLERLHALKRLVLVNTLITERGLARLRARRPDLAITVYNGPETEPYFRSDRKRSPRKVKRSRGSRE